MDSTPAIETLAVADRSTPRPASRALPLTWGAILVAFLFTFVNISCQRQRFISLSGLQLAFGTTIETPKMFGGTEKRTIPAEPLVTAALIVAVAGLAVTIRRAGPRTFAVVLGAAGFVLLLLYKSDTDREVLREGGGTTQVSYGGGFIMATLLFAAAAVRASGIADRLLANKESP